MSVATSVVITNAAIARHEAIEQCASYVQLFDSQKSSIAEKQQFANCIDLMYPSINTTDIIIFKLMIIFAFIGIAIGIHHAIKDKTNFPLVYLFYPLFFGAVSSLIPAILHLLFLAVVFLFS